MYQSIDKKIDTLVEDIYKLFGEKSGEVALSLEAPLVLKDNRSGDKPPTLRMSNIGKPLRQLWYEINKPKDREPIEPNALIKFGYGHFLEVMLLDLCVKAGHVVVDRQREVQLDGIKGHIDAIVDGVLIDCKSASTYSFNKFKDGTIRQDDPFGYIAQLAGYSEALGGIDAAFLVIDKTLGHVCLVQFSKEELQRFQVSSKIDTVRKAVGQQEPPSRCYTPVPYGKSGNESLAVGCSYCGFKHICWADANDGRGLRGFAYSQGPVWFTKVSNEPKVPEILQH